MFRSRGLGVGAFLAASAWSAAALAADVFVAPLKQIGVADDAVATFQRTVEETLANAGHEVVPETRASFRAVASIVKSRSRYELEVKATSIRGDETVATKSTVCAPCTIEEATKQLGLLVRTISLDLSAADERAAAKRAQDPPRAVLPPPRGIAAPPPPAYLRRSPGSAQDSSYEFTTAYKLMMWSGVLPGIAGTLTGLQLVNHAADKRRCGPLSTNCKTDGALLTAGLAVMLVGEGFALFNLVDLLFAEPGGKHLGKWNAWIGLASSVSLGFGSYLLLANDGYGKSWSKTLGYVNLPLAALASASSVGTLVSGTTRSRAMRTAAVIGPGYAGAQISF